MAYNKSEKWELQYEYIHTYWNFTVIYVLFSSIKLKRRRFSWNQGKRGKTFTRSAEMTVSMDWRELWNSKMVKRWQSLFMTENMDKAMTGAARIRMIGDKLEEILIAISFVHWVWISNEMAVLACRLLWIPYRAILRVVSMDESKFTSTLYNTAIILVGCSVNGNKKIWFRRSELP